PRPGSLFRSSAREPAADRPVMSPASVVSQRSAALLALAKSGGGSERWRCKTAQRPEIMQLFKLAAHHVEPNNIDVCRRDLENDGVEIAQARHKFPGEVNQLRGHWTTMGIQPVALLSHATGKVQFADPLQRNIGQEVHDRLPAI